MVQVNTHALEQYRARGGRGNLQKVVECKLRQQLKRGVTTTGDLLVEVPVSRGLKALCTPKFYDNPTFSPSILVADLDNTCHCFILDGKMEYLPDCTHELAGQVVELEDE